MSAAALARIPARCWTSVADHSGNARLAVSTASSTSCAPPLGTLPTTSSVAGLTTSISAPAAARRHSPPMSMAAYTVLSLRLDGSQITLYFVGRPSRVKRRGSPERRHTERRGARAPHGGRGPRAPCRGQARRGPAAHVARVPEGHAADPHGLGRHRARERAVVPARRPARPCAEQLRL